MVPRKLLKALVVKPGKRAHLDKRGTDWDFDKDLKKAGKALAKQRSEDILAKNLEDLAHGQNLLFASGSRSILIVLQAMDTGGKDGTIKHVMSGVNPQGCRVHSFKQPSMEEKAHDFLWRYSFRLPERGMIGIFNRSYYEDVLVVRVHPELLGTQEKSADKEGKRFWKNRFEAIREFERHLVENGTVVLKFFLHISKSEQKQRLLDRLEDPEKRWKFSPNDLVERAYWSEYQKAYDKAISATSTDWAPWYVVPADQKWLARAIVADVVTRAIEDLDLSLPKVQPAVEKALAAARRELGGKPAKSAKTTKKPGPGSGRKNS
ncbi:MAG: polyphosphate kinase 2 family protein [Gemmataceae bacterium]